MFLIAYRVTKVKGAFVDYMALLEFQDPLGQRQEKIYSAIITQTFSSLNSKKRVVKLV